MAVGREAPQAGAPGQEIENQGCSKGDRFVGKDSAEAQLPIVVFGFDFEFQAGGFMDTILDFFANGYTMLALIAVLVVLGLVFFLSKGKGDN